MSKIRKTLFVFSSPSMAEWASQPSFLESTENILGMCPVLTRLFKSCLDKWGCIVFPISPAMFLMQEPASSTTCCFRFRPFRPISDAQIRRTDPNIDPVTNKGEAWLTSYFKLLGGNVYSLNKISWYILWNIKQQLANCDARAVWT